MKSRRRVNLCFHGIGTPQRELEPGEDPYWISESHFEQVLDYVVSTPTVGLTFDDGNGSDVEIALPALKRRRLRAAFFPVAARIGQTGSVDRAGLRELVRAGMTIGSHGMDHRPWRGLDAAALEREVVEARAMISAEAGVPVSAAACPLGSYDRRVLGRLRQLDYAQVFTSDRSSARASGWLQPRYSLRGADAMDDVRVVVERRGLRERVVSGARITAKRWR